MKLRFAFIALSLVIVLSGCSKDSDNVVNPGNDTYDSKLATFLDSLRVAYNLPALAGAIITGNEIIDAQAVGCRKFGGNKNVTKNDKFHLGSNTKAFTATLIGILVDERKLTWETTLEEVFPELQNVIKAEYKDVTVKNILAHSAGLPGDPAITPTSGDARTMRYEIVQWAVQQIPAVPKGTYLYSNTGYIIAGAIAEKLTDKPYGDLLFEKVLTPLGINSAGFGPMGNVGAEDQPLQHYVEESGTHTPVEPEPQNDNPVTYDPAGRLHMNINDWAKYIQSVLRNENGIYSLVEPETAALLTSNITSIVEGVFYGLGWMVLERDWADGKTITHAGSNTVNYSVAWIAPNKDFAIILATNQGRGETEMLIDNAAANLIEFYFAHRY
ncbi:MAG: serine hydrolase domain-containing protein [bacterium]